MPRKGPYGHYVQLGEPVEDQKPKRVTLPKGIPPTELTLDIALGLLALPRDVGLHPETNKKIVAGIGRYGPFLRHDGAYASIPADDDVLTIGLNRAVIILAEPRRGGNQSQTLKTLGEHPDGGDITVKKGRYGPYVNHKRINATLPKGTEPEALTKEEALALLAAKAAKSGGKKSAAKPKPKAKPKAKAKSKSKSGKTSKTTKTAAPKAAAE